MPSNRRAQPEAEKRAELIAAARDLFLRDGYEATPINRIAQAAGVTNNTIYWYFKDKEQLLIAVLDELLQRDVAEYKEKLGLPFAEQLLWIVGRLRQISVLVTLVHSRIQSSPALDEWHTRLHLLFSSFIDVQFPTNLSTAERDAEMRVLAYTLEGMVAHELDESMTKQTCNALAARWVAVSQLR